MLRCTRSLLIQEDTFDREHPAVVGSLDLMVETLTKQVRAADFSQEGYCFGFDMYANPAQEPDTVVEYICACSVVDLLYTIIAAERKHFDRDARTGILQNTIAALRRTGQ